MKKQLGTLAVVFSVVLNLAFIGSRVYHASGLFHAANRAARHDRPLYEGLGLDRDQLDKFTPLRDRFHAFVTEQGRTIKTKQLEFVDLLAGENPDRRAIDAKQEEIQVLQRRMQTKVTDHLLDESKILTPEQRRKFFDLIKSRIETSAGPGPMWMPRRPARPSGGTRP